ncbi:formate dehydrogenase accessory sulfurtransferase FdhD [Variovorax sp. Root434]|uniref:formate dehydrogenase accessory sulfurtransferase FdhD n=1 Tax=Variovorax sp. Root434 TaxID=1736536 RepID=UPI0006FDAEE6|nr:formate dehydrogenase accessory sulfurtransferase FdhD [Variovorax sp. Root434]KQX24698.1 formate dehydrogenase family accessory protein FdhD [Variovorax sp. Root434]
MDIATLPAADGADTFCEGARLLPVHGVRGGEAYAVQDWVAEEVPVALEFNGISHAVMLATPLDLEDFALGFSLSEGILDHAHELYAVETGESELGITVRLQVSSAAFARLKQRRRTIAGRTGCGLCGTESLAHVSRELPVLADPAGPLERQAIARAMLQVQSLQTLQQATGAVHAAAWCSADGEVQWLREDVGRHNALDKLIGALANNDVDASAGFIAVTSRASFEMVQKTAMAGVPLLAAVSAPTSFAVATAERARLTLVGFARKDDLAVYSHPGRLAAAGYGAH